MYICSCHAVTDGAMRALIRSGKVKTFAQMAKTTGLATQCGICGRQAKELFYKILNEEIAAGNISATADGAGDSSGVSKDDAPASTARSRGSADSALVRARDWQRATARDRARSAKAGGETAAAAVSTGSNGSSDETDSACPRVCASCTCVGCPGKTATPESEG